MSSRTSDFLSAFQYTNAFPATITAANLLRAQAVSSGGVIDYGERNKCAILIKILIFFKAFVDPSMLSDVTSMFQTQLQKQNLSNGDAEKRKKMISPFDPEAKVPLPFQLDE